MIGQKFDPRQIKQETDLLSIASADTPLKKKGTHEHAGPCPFCGSGEDRFVVNTADPAGDKWLCRYCTSGKWQDVIHYIERREKLNFKQSIEYLTAGGVGLTPSNHRPLLKLNPHIALTPLVSSQDSPEFTDWQTSAGETVRGLPSAADDPAALKFLLGKGYTIETIRARGVKYNATWLKTDYINPDTGKPAHLAPGIVYAHYHDGKPTSITVRRISYESWEYDENGNPPTKAPMLKGSKPSAGIYGNLDQYAAPVVITAGQKDSDLVAQTHPGPVNAVTMGACGYDLPSWVIEKIAALNPPYVLVMFDNDPPSEQIEAEKRAAGLRAGLSCPVLVIPPPAGFKDFSDAVTGGADVGGFWARIVAPLCAEVIGLLCDYTKRYDWVKDAYGDLTNLAALLWVWHKGIERGLIGYDTPLTVNALVELSQMIGETVSIKVIRSGIQQAVTFDMWVVKSTCPTLDTYLNTLNTIPLSKLGKVGNNTGVYIPRSAFIQYQNLATALENQLDTPPNYWATAEFLEELARCGIHDRVTPLPLDQLNRLVFLRDPATLVSMPFVWPDGFTLSDYPNKRENERPGVSKCLRVGWLRYLHDQHTEQALNADIKTRFVESAALVTAAQALNADMKYMDGWQISAAALAALVGIAISSVSEYRRAAGLTTYEQKPETIILNDPSPFRQDMADLHRNACEWRRQDDPDYDGKIEVSNPVGQLERILDKYKGGVRVYLGYKPSYVTPENRQQILNAVAKIDGPIRVEIQLPSIQYAAPLDEIEAIHNERSDRHKKRVERAQKERAAAGDVLPKERIQHTPPPRIAPDAPEIAEVGYSKMFVYYHLLRLLPDLLEAAKTSLLIARVLVGYGLMKGDTMPKNEAYKDADLEAAPVVIPTANPLPVVTAAPTNRTISPVGQGGYPFGKEKYRLPGLPTDLPNYRDLQKGA